jgi:hypothetical protein
VLLHATSNAARDRIVQNGIGREYVAISVPVTVVDGVAIANEQIFDLKRSEISCSGSVMPSSPLLAAGREAPKRFSTDAAVRAVSARADTCTNLRLDRLKRRLLSLTPMICSSNRWRYR